MVISLYGKVSDTTKLCLFLTLMGAAGLYFGLPNAVLHLPLLALLFPFTLYILATEAPHKKAAFLRGWFLGLCGTAAGLYWTVFPMSDVAGIPLLLAVPCVLLLFAYLAIFPALTALGLYIQQERFGSAVQNRTGLLLVPLFGSLAYGGFEVLCGRLFSGFPWLSLSTTFAFQPVYSQAASVFGAYGLSALAAMAAFYAAAALQTNGKKRALAAAISLIVLLALPTYGLLRLNAVREEERPPLALIMVQGNIDQNVKWEPPFQKHTLDRYLALSKTALEQAASFPGRLTPSLVLWPETAMPFYFQLHHDYAAMLRDFAAQNGVYLAFGALGVERATAPPSLRNRLYLISRAGITAGSYDKEHLVPFGEYIPFALDIPFLGELLQGFNFTPGSDSNPLLIEMQDGPPTLLGALICYEAIFPELAQDRVATGAEILINISNDGWFRKSSAPFQHLAHAALRSVEQGRFLVRATNTGITAVFDSYGRLIKQFDGLFVEGTLYATATPSRTLTPYHRLYPAPEALMAVLAIFSIFSYKRRKTNNRTNNASTA